MRWDSLVHLSNRTVLEPVEVFGHQMEPGQEVFMIEGAANRDPEIWDDPDELVLNRPTQPSLGFGHGIHYCVAAPLSRMVNQTVLSALSRLDVELASDAPPPPSGAISMRSYDELRVAVRH
jgi:cytochrome P450